jgi:hypothetical protein
MTKVMREIMRGLAARLTLESKIVGKIARAMSDWETNRLSMRRTGNE